MFYTFFWASEIKNHLPSQDLDLSRAAGQWICQALVYAIFTDQSFNDTLTNDIVSFEQLGPVSGLLK